MEQQFDASIVGLQINNGKYVINSESLNGEPDAVLVIHGNKQFTFSSVLKIAKEINSYLPNLSTGEFKIKVDGIKFKCELARR